MHTYPAHGRTGHTHSISCRPEAYADQIKAILEEEPRAERVRVQSLPKSRYRIFVTTKRLWTYLKRVKAMKTKKDDAGVAMSAPHAPAAPLGGSRT